MTTELKHKESIFGNNSPLLPKTIRKVEPIIDTNESSPTLITTLDFENRLNDIKRDKQISSMDILQAELQLQMIRHLEAIDWKLWEIYNRFIK